MFEEMSRIVKPGGFILIVINQEYTRGDWQNWETLTRLEERGILKCRPMKLVPKYRMNVAMSDSNNGNPPNGAVMVYEITRK